MSRTLKAAYAAGFTYLQFALALVSGFVLFPIVVRTLGAYDNGLWLVTGEVVGILFLGDFGVFSVLPWLVATKDGEGDRVGIARYLSDALAVGVVLAVIFGLAAIFVWVSDPGQLGMKPENYAKIRSPLTVLLVLNAAGLPMRAVGGVLAGLQDVLFLGSVNIAQAALTITLTFALILSGAGLEGLAIAAGIPPLVGGFATAVRLWLAYPDIAANLRRPNTKGCVHILQQGLGAWLGAFGVRLTTATSGLIFGALGRPEWATLYNATGKLIFVAQPMCAVIPDAGLVGLTQLAAGNNQEATRRALLCLLLLFLLISGFAAIGLLVLNASFVYLWLGPDYYAGHATTIFLALSLLVGSIGGGMFKVVGVIGFRVRIGLATIAAGVVTLLLGFYLGSSYGVPGVALAGLVGLLLIMLPYGLFAMSTIYRIPIREYLAASVGPWILRAGPVLILAAWLGTQLVDSPPSIVAGVAVVLFAAYVVAVRPLINDAPWPTQIHTWLVRLRIAQSSR